jgi:hypothetical protein
MKVAAVIHQFPPDFTTGTEILCLHSVQALAARGHEMRVFAADPHSPAGSPPRHQSVQGIDVRRIGTGRPRRLLLAQRMIDEFSNPAAEAHLIAELQAFGPDVIHLYQSQQFGLAAVPVMAALAPVLGTVTDFHLVCPLVTASFEDGSACAGPDPDGTNCIAHLQSREQHRLVHEAGFKRAGLGMRQGLRRLPGADTQARLGASMTRRTEAARAALGAIDLALIGPPRLRALLRELPAARIELYGHAAPPLGVPHRPVGDRLCVGFFSSISPHKGLHVLLDAIALIPQETGMHFTICGPPGPDANYVREMTLRAGADPRIAFKPGVPHDQVGAEMGKADIIVIPSLWDENNPLVLLDALEGGRYVVVSASPGMCDAIAEPQGGRSFPIGDADALAASLCDLAGDPAPVRQARANPVRRSQFATYIDTIEARYAAICAARAEAVARVS